VRGGDCCRGRGRACARALLTAFALSTALAAGGCERGPETRNGEGRAGVDRASVLKSAPAEFNDFLRWAETELQRPMTAIPPPDSPVLSPPRWEFVRLDDADRMANARVQTSWKPTEGRAAALLDAGPFRSDQPNPQVERRIAKAATADGQDALELTVRGLSVPCVDVGSIVLSMRVPFGRSISLQWSKAGEITIPVPTNEDVFPVRVTTEGLAEWEGTLSQITFQTDGVGDAPLIIEKLVFMPRVNAFPKAFDAARVRLGHDVRNALYAHTPAEVAFRNVVLPPRAQLRCGLGFVARDRDAGATGGVRFEIVIEREGERHSVLTFEAARQNEWHEASADLSEWSGKTVAVCLTASDVSSDAVAFWANPVIYEPQEDAPLAIVYLIDTLAGGHVELYGAPRSTMPRLTALSERGVLFRQAFSNSSRTIESIPDLMLSMPTERHQVHHNSRAAPAGLVTLAEALRAAGFATISLCTNVNGGPRQGMDRGFDTFIDKIGFWWSGMDRTIPLEEALAWLDANSDRPRFMYVHTAEPHAPYTPPEGFAGRLDPDYSGHIDGTYNRATGFRNIQDPTLHARDWQHVVALYDEEILYADHRLGLFVDELTQRGLLDRVHLFVLSDHGEEFLEHGTWEHGMNLHGEQTRIPLVALGPGLPAKTRIDAPVQVFDVMPTILDLFGLPLPYELDGTSLLPLVRGEAGALERASRRDIYLSNHNYRISLKLIEHGIIEAGRWKLLYGWRPWRTEADGPPSRFVLFDLSADPAERDSLIASQPDVARRLIEKLLVWNASHAPYDAGLQDEQYEVSPEEIRQLQQMGYVGGTGTQPDESKP
jgi:arylsulfatase A-like enzyme